MIAPNAPRNIHLETPHFILRTVEPEDVTLRWAAWLADPVKTRMLNAKPMTLSLDDICSYVANFDHDKAHCLGIFERASGGMIGFWEVYVDWTYREFLINVLIGERGRLALRAREETQQVLHAHFFGELGLEAMRCSVMSTNELVKRVLAEKGAVHEHTSVKPCATGDNPVTILHFRLTRADWATARARRLEREAAAAMTRLAG
jgi:RimJ/RimL family protein N-acetyltransferase